MTRVLEICIISLVTTVTIVLIRNLLNFVVM